MANSGSILVGTVGQGIMRSTDYGENWRRGGRGFHSDAIVHCLTTHPAEPKIIFAGSERGLYRSDDGGESYRLLSDTAIGQQATWAVAIDPSNPDHMIAGTGTPNPGGLYRSDDGGQTWARAVADIAESCPAVGIPRPLALAIDHTNPNSAWAAFEVDGVRHSTDGGSTWERAALDIPNLDIHSVVVTAGPPKTVFVLVNNDIWRSEDDGATWKNVGAGQVFTHHFVRSIAVHPDNPREIFVTLGDATPGSDGTVVRSKDTGKSWENLALPGHPNSAMWTVTLPKTAPGVVLATSRFGELYRSEDDGDSWVKLWREFPEVHAVAYVPGEAGVAPERAH